MFLQQRDLDAVSLLFAFSGNKILSKKMAAFLHAHGAETG